MGAAAAAFLIASIGVAADEDYSAADGPDADPGIEFQTTTTSFGGASPLASSRTVDHWSGMTANGVDGVIFDPVTIDVPDGIGILMTPGFITYANVDSHWFSTRIQNQLGRLKLDPTRLAIFLTDDVILSDGPSPAGGFVLGAHGAGPATSSSNGSAHGNGDQPVQTFIWSSWLTPGFFKKATNFAVQDVYSLSHEVVEWANNPFGDNTVLPWQSVTAPQYGCSNEFETGDPVFRYGFTLGHNPLHERFSDGTYHLSDEALLPWFMRSAAATQDGRFTFLGHLNPVASFHQPAPSC